MEQDIYTLALKNLYLLVQLYLAEFCEALPANYQECYTTALTNASQKNQKTLLLILKRLIKSQERLLENLKVNGESLISVIEDISSKRSSDSTLLSLAEEIINMVKWEAEVENNDYVLG